MTYREIVQQTAQALHSHMGCFVIVAHENPDGDALGSVLGLSRALRESQKEVYACLEVPRYLRFLPEDGELFTTLPEEIYARNDVLLVVADVDNNDPARVAGADLTRLQAPVINIDHHGTNKRQADIVLVDETKSSATQLVADVIEEMGIGWSPEIATPLLLGLMTDTGNFSFESVDAEAFSCAAVLRGHGARLGWLTDQMRQNPASYYLLLREVLGTITWLHNGAVVMARVDGEMLARAGATWEEVESYVGLLRNSQGSLLAVMVKDFDDKVKLSLRSRGNISASRVAQALGGGGHTHAAGASLAQTWQEVEPMLLAAIETELQSEPQQ